MGRPYEADDSSSERAANYHAAGNGWFVERDCCPVCHAREFKMLYEAAYNRPPLSDYLVDFYSPQGMVEFEYLDGASYVLYECQDCTAIFQRDIPNDALMERLYEHWINPRLVFAEHQKLDGLAYYAYQAEEIMQILSYLGRAPSAMRFLDFGMGWGTWALMAKAFGCISYGSELSEERIRHASSNGIRVISWDDIPSERFDFINTEQVFEHIPHPLDTLLHLKKALTRGGVFKISVPYAPDIARRLKLMDWKAAKDTRNSLNPVAPLEHINFYTRQAMLRMAEKAGMQEIFIPIKTQYQYVTNWSSARRIARNILVPIYRNLLKRQNYMLLRSAQPN